MCGDNYLSRHFKNFSKPVSAWLPVGVEGSVDESLDGGIGEISEGPETTILVSVSKGLKS